MADDQITTVSTSTPASAAPVDTAAPVSAVDTSAGNSTVVSAAPADSVVSAPTADSIAAPAAVEAIVSPLTDSVDPAKEIKPDAVKDKAKTDGEVKPVIETKTELPTYEQFKLPENVNLDKAPISEFAKLLGEIEVGKLDHKGFQETGQKLIDLAVQATQDSLAKQDQFYKEYHENQKKEWLEGFKNDPEIGGAKLVETVSNLKDAIETYGGTAEQIAKIRTEMKNSGLGLQPDVIRFINNMQKQIQKYNTEGDNGNGGNNRIVAANRPAPLKVKPQDMFYS